MNMNQEQTRNINRGLRELGAANDIHVEPIAADDLALMLLVRMDGTIETNGQAPLEVIPSILRAAADGIELDLDEGFTPTKSQGSGLL